LDTRKPPHGKACTNFWQTLAREEAAVKKRARKEITVEFAEESRLSSPETQTMANER